MSEESGLEDDHTTRSDDVRTVDAVAIAMVGGFLAGVAVTVGYSRGMALVFLVGTILLVATLVATYIRLEGVPDREDLVNPGSVLRDRIVNRRE